MVKVTLDSVKRGKLIGRGTQAIAWSAKDKDGKDNYVIKIRYITRIDSEMKSYDSSSVRREIRFLRDLYDEYGAYAERHFSTLYDYYVGKSGVQEDKYKSEGMRITSKYNYIFISLSDKKDGDLHKIYKKLDQGQWFSMLAQISFALHMMQSLKWTHHDVWSRNITYNIVDKDKKIKVFDKYIPTFGYIWSLIDYGDVEYQRNKGTDDFAEIINLASGYEDIVENPLSQDPESKNFKKKIRNDRLDFPSISAAMNYSGLDEGAAFALINIQAFAWYLCNYLPKNTKSYIPRELLLKMADARSSYHKISILFSNMAIQENKQDQDVSKSR